ncbi:lipocalin-like domain-containing protein [Shewanella gelidii]|nr:lipocalin-like domain-containing protein [Shewanella gelidii]MCL1097869.1 carotenoid 1,2-hydratase [Shewanella gelidii]
MKRLQLTTSIGLVSLVSACSPQQQTRDEGKLSILSQQQQGFATVSPQANLSFPRDHQAHEDYKVEWWYLTANLTTDSGEPLGLQWTQFRIALGTPFPPNEADLNPSQEYNTNLASEPAANSWQTQQLYMAHAAVTQPKQHVAAEKWSRGHPQIAGVSSTPLTIQLDNWRWQSQSEALFPATLEVQDQAFAYQLQLDSQSPLQLQGDAGYSIKTANGKVASYYYSQPFIDISGTMTLNGNTQKVHGKGWLDREWSSQFLTRSQQGWDWFALRLNDGSALMLFQLRGEKVFYSGRRMYADGRGENISHGDIMMQVRQWHETDQGRYPVNWRIAIASQNIDVTIEPLNVNSAMPLSTQYWEGPIEVRGSHQGNGYMELTGYEK